jgi:hypothetical protein
MTVLWQINLEHHVPGTPDVIEKCVGKIMYDFFAIKHCRPRLIQLAANGIGACVGELLIAKGLPVEILGPAHWRQTMDPLNDGPRESEEETSL